jgi:hypothetical protein
VITAIDRDTDGKPCRLYLAARDPTPLPEGLDREGEMYARFMRGEEIDELMARFGCTLADVDAAIRAGRGRGRGRP